MSYYVGDLKVDFVYFFRAYAAYEDRVEVSPSIEHDERNRLIEYAAKLKVYDYTITDPLKIPQSSWIPEKDSIQKWPSLYYHDIAKYHLAPEFLCKLDCNL